MTLDLFEKFNPILNDYNSLPKGEANPFTVSMEKVLSPTTAIINGRKTILAGTNNYMGMTFNAECVAAAQEALSEYGTGTTGSRVLNGTYSSHKKLEDTLKKFYGVEHAIVFSTGYQANLGVISTLAGPKDYVVIDADSLSESDMQKVAAKTGLSETAFVSRSDQCAFRLDFFTPNRRIAHCGHATIATFSYLADIGRVEAGDSSKETVDGPRKIILKNNAAYMEQLAPKYENEADWTGAGVTDSDIIASLGLSEEDRVGMTPPTLVNTGNSFVIVQVKSADILSGLKPDFEAITEISEKLDLIGYYVFTKDATDQDASTRMFGPRYGIKEEAATGMAAGPLACLLYDRLEVNKETIKIEQGVYMTSPSPSILTAELNIEAAGITGLMVGGQGRVMEERLIQL